MERKEPRFTGRVAMGLGRIKAEAQKGDAGKAPYHLLPPTAIHDVVLALEEGAPGDVIRLRNNSSYKEIRGKIINGRTVQLSL